jgi:ectoine hydroxylase-related dioxygenase (phytanoyl-CoA dioxygenase family)
MSPDQIRAELDDAGFVILKGFLSADECAEIVDFMDSTIAAGHVKDPGRGSSEFHHRICHPIEHPIAAKLAAHRGLYDIAAHCLHAQNLRLRQQMFLLTEPSGKPAPAKADGWHVDTLFLPDEWNGAPRKTFLQVFCYATAVRPGGAATLVVPYSHHKTLAAAGKAAPTTDEERFRVAGKIVELSGVDLSEAVELTCDAGDVALFSPMLLHSGSNNVIDQPRYAFHCSYHDNSAGRIRHLPAPVFYDTFPASMESQVPSDIRPLLER